MSSNLYAANIQPSFSNGITYSKSVGKNAVALLVTKSNCSL
ncbi:MAG: hypothetical protein Q8S84_05485 [bacterium]|nr:hypothetical protein [bacterium]MDP3380943.1 hypothetical protein [bacterium]